MAIQKITAKIIADGAIIATDIADGSITTAKIADANVTAAKLATGAALPSQSGNTNYYLTTDGTNSVWKAQTALAVANTQLTGSIESTQVGTTVSQLFGMRNRIINGDMRIDQRNAGASVTPTDGQYTVDRWQIWCDAASKLTAQQSTTVPTGHKNSLLITSTSAYSIDPANQFSLLQPIEGLNVSDLGWGAAGASTVTLSFWVRSSLTGTFGGVIRNSAGDRGYVFSYTISSANTWEYKTVTIAGDTTGTWLTTNGVGIYVGFSLGAGSSKVTTAGSWGSTVYYGVTGQQNLVANNGATFYITGVQLEVGSTATPFERRQYGQELALCQRYYLKLNSGAQTAYTSFGMGVAYTTTAASITVNYPVQMRANPTYNSGNSLRLVGSGVTAVTSSSLGQTSYLSSYITVNVASGLTTNNAYWFGPNGDSTAFIDFSAEL